MTYAANGNIKTKSDISADPYQYETVRFNAVQTIPNSTLTNKAQTINYTAFSQPRTIAEYIGANNDLFTLTFHYGSDEERVMTTMTKKAGVAAVATLNTRYYFGDYEEYRSKTGAAATDTIRGIHYLGGDGLNVILVSTKIGTAARTYEYLNAFTDYLGSIQTLALQDGTVQLQRAYDAWGRARNATDWTATPAAPTATELKFSVF